MKYILLLTLSAAALLLGNAGCQKEMDSELDDRAGTCAASTNCWHAPMST